MGFEVSTLTGIQWIFLDQEQKNAYKRTHFINLDIFLSTYYKYIF